MKQFKRKLARVFGLALRSDLYKVQEAYEGVYDMKDRYLADIMTITDPNTNYAKKEELVSLYNFQRQVSYCLWQGDTMGDARSTKHTKPC